ncbi:hypothetical protein M419DRAFT_125049, partial [Trichoderma reesei RUT C-30]
MQCAAHEDATDAEPYALHDKSNMGSCHAHGCPYPRSSRLRCQIDENKRKREQRNQTLRGKGSRNRNRIKPKLLKMQSPC